MNVWNLRLPILVIIRRIYHTLSTVRKFSSYVPQKRKANVNNQADSEYIKNRRLPYSQKNICATFHLL